jgi:hypothetical protein
MMPQCCRSNAVLAVPFRRDVAGLRRTWLLVAGRYLPAEQKPWPLRVSA